jgi:RsiW-degrading membrane proteinase PrsW (M82 family)
MSETTMTPPAPTAQAVGRAHLVDTQSFVFWVFAVAVVYSGIHLFSNITSSPVLQVNPAVGWWALILWSLYAIAFLAIIYHHQLFVRRSAWVTVGALLWGGVVATWFAVKANAAMEDLFDHWFAADFNDRWGTAIAAATNEELLKTLGIVVLLLLPLARVRSTLDGWFYGCMIGLGFQVVEDYIYTTAEAGDLGGVWEFVLQRGFIAGLWAHAVYSGIIGAGVGYLVTRKDQPLAKRILIAVGLFAVVWFFHFAWDAPYLNERFGESTGGFLAVVLIKGLPALLTLLLVVRWGRDHERKVWTAFVDGTIDPDIVSEQEAADLLSRRSRRAARRRAGHEGGRRAGHLRKRLQLAQLRYVQDVQETGADSTHAKQGAELIRQIRLDPAFA